MSATLPKAPSAAPSTRANPADASSASGARRVARVAVIGASGYSGQEFARLAAPHAGIEIVALCSREHAGRPASELLPGLDPRTRVLPEVQAPDSVLGLLESNTCDTVVACLPHGAWSAMVTAQPALEELAAHVVDLSSDHRDGARGYVYGLPEAFRAELEGATRIANPGCYPTAAMLALYPALKAGWIQGPVMVNALSGVSGAGRAPGLRTSYVELEGGASLYQAGSVHAHVPEMERNFARVGAPVAVGFAPHLAPMARGILLTATAALATPHTPAEALAEYRTRYAGEPFVHVLAADEWPETRQVRGSNRCDVAVTTLHGGTTLLVAAAIDNLVKGAAGQAIQNLNLALGWPEAWGLPIHGTPW